MLEFVISLLWIAVTLFGVVVFGLVAMGVIALISDASKRKHVRLINKERG